MEDEKEITYERERGGGGERETARERDDPTCVDPADPTDNLAVCVLI